MVRSGELPSLTIGRLRRVRAEDLLEWEERRAGGDHAGEAAEDHALPGLRPVARSHRAPAQEPRAPAPSFGVDAVRADAHRAGLRLVARIDVGQSRPESASVAPGGLTVGQGRPWSSPVVRGGLPFGCQRGLP